MHHLLFGTYRIAPRFIPVMLKADYSGLSLEEQNKLSEFYTSFPARLKHPVWIVSNIKERDLDVVTGEYTEVVEVKLYHLVDE